MHLGLVCLSQRGSEHDAQENLTCITVWLSRYPACAVNAQKGERRVGRCNSMRCGAAWHGQKLLV